ncbi:hypothetical protein ACOI1C_20345 [Bacillus sp. DJP31]|uniref:hypothetical protein n=1 Tax=Bacillus sp. DJP31 TaxID=3409789 RepID=UPI003BB54B45
MRFLTALNRAYEEVIHGEVKEPYRSLRLAKLMSEMERPAIRDLRWESQNKAVIALYRKISMSREL